MLIKKNDEYQEQCKQDYLHELRLEHKDEGTTEDSSYETNIKKVNSTGGVVDPQILADNDTALNDRETALNAAEINFKNFKTKANKTLWKEERGKFQEQKKNNEDYLKGKEDKVKVVAFLTENKSKTKVTKTFTITKDGLT